MAGLVEEHDEVDVGRVVELAGAELAHGEGEHAAGLGDLRLGDAGELAASDLGGDEGLEAELDGAVGEPAERRGDIGEIPGAAEIGERDQERGAAAGDAQRVGEGGDAVGGHGGENGGEDALGRLGERGAQPLGLALDQAGEEGRAAGGAFEERAGRAGQVGEGGGDVGHEREVVRARRARDAVGEGAGHRRFSGLHSVPGASR